MDLSALGQSGLLAYATEDDIITTTDYPATLMAPLPPNATTSAFIPGQRGGAAQVQVKPLAMGGSLPYAETLIWNTFPEPVMRRLGAAANTALIKGILMRHRMLATNINVRTMVDIGNNVLEGYAMERWLKSSGMPIVGQLVAQMSTFGLCVYNVKVIRPDLDPINMLDELRIRPVRVSSMTSDSAHFVNPAQGERVSLTSTGARTSSVNKTSKKRTTSTLLNIVKTNPGAMNTCLTALADALEINLGYTIDCLDIGSVIIEYTLVDAVTDPIFRVRDRITGQIIPSARVVAPSSLMQRRDATLIIASPMVSAWTSIYTLASDQRFMSKSLRNATKEHIAYVPRDKAPTTGEIMTTSYGSLPVAPGEMADARHDFNVQTNVNNFDIAHMGLKAWKGWRDIIMKMIANGEATISNPAQLAALNEIPEYFMSPPVMPPNNYTIMPLNPARPPELAVEVVKAEMDKIFAAFGTMKSTVVLPETLGRTSLGQFDAHREGVTDDQKSLIEDFVRLIIAQMDWDINVDDYLDCIAGMGQLVGEFSRNEQLKEKQRLEREGAYATPLNNNGVTSSSSSTNDKASSASSPAAEKQQQQQQSTPSSPSSSSLNAASNGSEEEKAREKEEKQKESTPEQPVLLSAPESAPSSDTHRNDAILLGLVNENETVEEKDEEAEAKKASDELKQNTELWSRYLGSMVELSVVINSRMSGPLREEFRRLCLDTRDRPNGMSTQVYTDVSLEHMGLLEIVEKIKQKYDAVDDENQPKRGRSAPGSASSSSSSKTKVLDPELEQLLQKAEQALDGGERTVGGKNQQQQQQPFVEPVFPDGIRMTGYEIDRPEGIQLRRDLVADEVRQKFIEIHQPEPEEEEEEEGPPQAGVAPPRKPAAAAKQPPAAQASKKRKRTPASKKPAADEEEKEEEEEEEEHDDKPKKRIVTRSGVRTQKSA